MSTFLPPSCRALRGPDLECARRFASRLGLHGVYLANALAATREIGASRDPTRSLLGSEDVGGNLRLLAWVGSRGNLMIGRPSQPGESATPRGGHQVLDVAPAIDEPATDEPATDESATAEAGTHESSTRAWEADDSGHAEALLAGIAADRSPWRIALGPDSVIDELARRDDRPVLVHRPQLYCGFGATGATAAVQRDDVRPAQRSDLRALVQAALELNASDLNVAQWRVHRGWLRDSVRRRLREGRTFVIGPVGDPWCKLDLGSVGPAGVVIEGVHTVPAHRGRGLATGLVATVGARLLAEHPTVCLHVAVANEAACRAYRAAGMVEEAVCRLLLLG